MTTKPHVDTRITSDPERTRDLIHILVVEDDPINMLVARKLLEKHFTIHAATNDQEAFAALEKQEFQVILMDINLGSNSMDGVEVMRHIRQARPEHCPLIFAVTSYAMPEDEERFLRAGFDRYFPKPIEKYQLIEAIWDNL